MKYSGIKIQEQRFFQYFLFSFLLIIFFHYRSIGIGVTSKNDYPLDSQPGWHDGGWGYHGDDGNKYWYSNECCNNDYFGPCYGEGDVIGCGINNVTSQLFFTKNGSVIDGVAFENIPTDTNQFYPFICLGSKGEKVIFNIGQIPFLWNFDIESILSEVAAPKAEYDKSSLAKNRKDLNTYEIALRTLLKFHPV